MRWTVGWQSQSKHDKNDRCARNQENRYTAQGAYTARCTACSWIELDVPTQKSFLCQRSAGNMKSFRFPTSTLLVRFAVLALPTISSGQIATGSSLPVMRSCLNPQHLEEECTIPRVAERICHGASCKTPQDGTGVCGVVAHALLREFEIFDIVLLNDGLCHDEMNPGVLTRQDVESVLPFNQDLVALKLNGSDLLAALEHGLDLNHAHGVKQAYPALAGIRFKVNLNTPYGNRISRPQVLDSSCRWQPLKPRATYQVLTNEALANGYYDYFPLTKAISRTETKMGVTDVFWQHSQSACTIRDPYPRRPVKHTQRPPKNAGLSVCAAKQS